jgi:hypothetical protein
VLTESRSQSPYLTDVNCRVPLSALSWSNLPPVPSLDAPKLEIRVLNAYEVREQLKGAGYRWHSADKYWHKAVAAESFSLAALLGQPWARRGVTIETYSEAGQCVDRRSVS